MKVESRWNGTTEVHEDSQVVATADDLRCRFLQPWDFEPEMRLLWEGPSLRRSHAARNAQELLV